MKATIIVLDSKYRCGSRPLEVQTEGKSRLKMLNRYEMDTDSATSVSMLAEPCLSDRIPALKKRLPHQNTTGVASAHSRYPLNEKSLNPIEITITSAARATAMMVSFLSALRDSSASASARE